MDYPDLYNLYHNTPVAAIVSTVNAIPAPKPKNNALKGPKNNIIPNKSARGENLNKRPDVKVNAKQNEPTPEEKEMAELKEKVESLQNDKSRLEQDQRDQQKQDDDSAAEEAKKRNEEIIADQKEAARKSDEETQRLQEEAEQRNKDRSIREKGY